MGNSERGAKGQPKKSIRLFSGRFHGDGTEKQPAMMAAAQEFRIGWHSLNYGAESAKEPEFGARAPPRKYPSGGNSGGVEEAGLPIAGLAQFTSNRWISGGKLNSFIRSRC